MGDHAVKLLRRWSRVRSYLLVDLWGQQTNYADKANRHTHLQEHYMVRAQRRTRFAGSGVRLCRNFSTSCAMMLSDESIDFVYLDARHDYNGVLQDIHAYWPKLRRDGIMGGHDYIYASEHEDWRGVGAINHTDFSLNGDGTRDPLQRAVKGAVDEFFTQCVPRQIMVTYRESPLRYPVLYNSWYVRK